ncbi:MBL fold metallo-hydrolase [Candidatus Wolfebacteria bacterium]|nr:MBL fold metallo-hydrolase [Candidatus Wolfebacteria bacterium]
MVISFYGEGCFKIQSADTTILIDQVGSESGLTQPRFKFDVELKTLASVEAINSFGKEQKERDGFQIIGPGEYNAKDVKITGFGILSESSEKFIKTIYLAEIEGIKLCFLGHISEIPLADIMEHLEEIDILFISAGGKPFLDQKTAAALIKKISPKIVIPSFYKVPGLKRKADDLKVFLETMGKAKEKIEPQEKLTIKKKDLAEIKKLEIMALKI